MSRLTSLEDFWAEFLGHAERASGGGRPVLFRGEPEAGFKLIPSIARRTEENLCSDINFFEDELLREFKLAAAPVMHHEPASDIEWLFLAQHYGLPTRLLDWSTNPMVALFFAVEKDDDKDAVMHIIDHQITDNFEYIDFKNASVKKTMAQGVLKIFALQPDQGDVMFVRPKYVDSRYLNQKSVFSCPANPFKPLLLSDQYALKIRSEWKPKLRSLLRTFGVVHSFIYPGLDGVAKEVKSSFFDPVQQGRLVMMSFHANIDLSKLE